MPLVAALIRHPEMLGQRLPISSSDGASYPFAAEPHYSVKKTIS
jgi:hypothetical protein